MQSVHNGTGGSREPVLAWRSARVLR